MSEGSGMTLSIEEAVKQVTPAGPLEVPVVPVDPLDVDGNGVMDVLEEEEEEVDDDEEE